MGETIESGLPVPGRVRVARQLRALTQQETVSRMDRERISAAALSQIEAGRVRPTRATLTALADALDVPEGFFSARWPGVRDAEPLAFFRDLRATSVRVRRRSTALAMLLNDLLAAIEHHVRLPELRVPNLPISEGEPRGAIEETAERMRREWDLGEDPIPHVVRELERRGVPVARLTTFEDSVDAFSVRFTRRPLVILTGDTSNYVRSRFDAAHELGHLVMHQAGIERQRSIEQQAHDFASSFLFPPSAAERELPRRLNTRAWGHLAELKRHWGVSMAALLYRAQALHILNLDAYRTAMKYMSAKGWRTAEPGDREMGPPEAPLLLERAVRHVEVETGLTLDALIQEAQLPLADTLELVHAAVDRRPTIEF